jgi:hypothetical protein
MKRQQQLMLIVCTLYMLGTTWVGVPAPAHAQDMSVQWGQPGDIPVPGHYLSSGPYLDLAVFRPSNGTWYIRGKSTTVQWGVFGDKPVPADYDADGKTDIAVWRPSAVDTSYFSVWYIIDSSTGRQHTEQLGYYGDIPVAGDFDADGHADLAVWRPSNGTWYVFNLVTNTKYEVQWGTYGDIPLAAHIDGQRGDDYAVWRPGTGTWWLRSSSQFGTAAQYGSANWGEAGDTPFVFDTCGVGGSEPGIFVFKTGHWSTVTAEWSHPHLGMAADIPVPGNYLGGPADDYAVWRPSDGTWSVDENKYVCIN